MTIYSFIFCFMCCNICRNLRSRHQIIIYHKLFTRLSGQRVYFFFIDTNVIAFFDVVKRCFHVFKRCRISFFSHMCILQFFFVLFIAEYSRCFCCTYRFKKSQRSFRNLCLGFCFLLNRFIISLLCFVNFRLGVFHIGTGGS